jgi:hypothetical protein
MRTSAVHTYTTPLIGPNQMVVFSLFDTTTYSPVVNDDRVGGMTITAGQPLAGVVLEHFTTENPATVLQGTRGFTSANFDTTAYAPVIKHDRFGRFTGIQVQNVDSVPISVTVLYKGTAGLCAGNTYTDTQTNILPNDSHTFVQFEGRTDLIPDCTATATINGTGNIVAIANESYRSDSIPASGQAAVTSSTIPDRATTTRISAPLFKDDRFSKRTGLQIQNVSATSDANVVATFRCSGGASFTAISTVQTITPGSAVLFHTPSDDNATQFTSSNPFVAPNVNCAVTVVSADERIVAIGNESITPLSQGGTIDMDNNNYEGFNLAP